uniref:ATP synthase subunit a n=1 Tax=Cylindrus obtusus TaxID=649475 RepID=I1T1X5_9EUPU|nr:ATP synthase F0 subunit 6 [Cylindrus obtusus]AEK48355.1 ATP synthase F0 subunit 6 [Cylindrus obtusus]
MFTDLFSSLDGAHTILLWLPSSLAFGPYFLSRLNMHTLPSSLTATVNSVWSSSATKRFQCFPQLLATIFTILLLLNLCGLTPLTYTLTSDLLPMFSLGLLCWLFLLLSGFVSNFQQSVGHLTPSGAPFALAPFLVLIETISLLIRPVTLTVRLIANISAGHIVLGLLANTLSTYTLTFTMLPLLLGSTLYYLFEFFVAGIQAYIFTLLVSLYQAEHP